MKPDYQHIAGLTIDKIAAKYTCNELIQMGRWHLSRRLELNEEAWKLDGRQEEVRLAMRANRAAFDETIPGELLREAIGFKMLQAQQ